jgi:hypothetical protein
VRALPLLLIVAMAAPARADDELAEARRLEGVLEYEQALAIVERVLAHGGADPTRTSELHLFAGQLAAGLDRPVIAEDHFARVLALRPDTALPEGTSPKLTAPFSAARSRVTPLRVTATITSGLVTIMPDPDPLHLVSGVQVHVVDPAGHHADVGEPRGLRVQLQSGVTALEIAALDAAGNHVWVSSAPPDSAATKRPHEEPVIGPPVSRPLYARWSAWATLSGVALASGGLCAWRFRVAQDQWNTGKSGGHDYSELVDLESRGRRWGLAANISFGVAAAAGLTAAIVYLTHRDEPPSIAITATPESIGVAGRF